MTPSAPLFESIFDQFVQSYIDQSTPANQGLLTYFDKDWMSPCIKSDDVINKANEDLVPWQPFSRAGEANLSNIEEALSIKIPQELQYLFCAYYSHDLNAHADDGNFTILQAWNECDFDRLQKNLIAHVLMKRRLKQADTLFFAITDEEDIVLSIDIATGAVVVERVGKEPHKTVAVNLSEFINLISPAPALVEL